jgi:Putative addiction module component
MTSDPRQFRVRTAKDHLPAGYDIFIFVTMSKTEILEELPKLTKTERQEIRLRLAELDDEDWLGDEDPLTVHEKALLDARLAAYAKDPDAGSTWEEVEGRIRARPGRRPNA